VCDYSANFWLYFIGSDAWRNSKELTHRGFLFSICWPLTTHSSFAIHFSLLCNYVSFVKYRFFRICWIFAVFFVDLVVGASLCFRVIYVCDVRSVKRGNALKVYRRPNLNYILERKRKIASFLIWHVYVAEWRFNAMVLQEEEDLVFASVKYGERVSYRLLIRWQNDFLELCEASSVSSWVCVDEMLVNVAFAHKHVSLCFYNSVSLFKSYNSRTCKEIVSHVKVDLLTPLRSFSSNRLIKILSIRFPRIEDTRLWNWLNNLTILLFLVGKSPFEIKYIVSEIVPSHSEIFRPIQLLENSARVIWISVNVFRVTLGPWCCKCPVTHGRMEQEFFNPFTSIQALQSSSAVFCHPVYSSRANKGN